MKVCMIVFNNVTKDHRVLREAETLQAAGHDVHVVGIPDASAMEPVLVLESGVTVHRVQWQANAYASLLRSAALRILPFFLLMAALVWGALVAIETVLVGTQSFLRFAAGAAHLMINGLPSWIDWARYLLYFAIGVATLFLAVRLTAGYVAAWSTRKRQDSNERETIRRFAGELLAAKLLDPEEYPKLSSRVPDWLPESILELLLEPMDWLGGRSGRFVFYRFRAAEVADLVMRLKPDVVHAHDCIALPAAATAKKRLGIPLVYDAHEVYDAAASRKFGIVDYYVRIHRKYLRFVDRFITINDSAARFYRYAYPELSPAVVIRNATCKAPAFDYDGRMHDLLEMPRSRKILLYQGGYTLERGLPTIVRAAQYFPDDWVLVMMGWGPLAGPLRRQTVAARRRRPNGVDTRDEASAQKVYFLPPVRYSELPFWTAGATAGIIPYEDTVFNHWICTPNKLWEFPNAGVPIIVQPFPELRAVVETYHCGWVLPADLTPGTVADLVASLTDVMIAEARQGCRRFIEADSWEAVYAPRLTTLYRALTQERGRVRPEAGGGAVTPMVVAAHRSAQ